MRLIAYLSPLTIYISLSAIALFTIFVVFCDVDMENYTTPLSDQFCMLTKIDAVCDCGELPNLNFLRSGQVFFDCIPYPLCLFRILIFRGRYVNMK